MRKRTLLWAMKKGTKLFTFKEKEKLPYLIEKEGKLTVDPIGKRE
jgi:hypothetical protein